MTDMLRYMFRYLPFAVPFFLLGLLSARVNLKKQIRSRQAFMPLLALLYGIVTSAVLIIFYDTFTSLIRTAWHWMRSQEWLLNLYGQLTSRGISFHISDFISNIGHSGVMQVIFGIIVTLDMALYLVYKFVAIKFLKHLCKGEGGLMDLILSPFYRRDEEDGTVYLLMNRTRSRGFLKVLYYTTLTVMTLAALASCYLFDEERLNMPVNPVFAVILVGEIYFFLCGITKEESKGSEAGEDDDARGIGSYSIMRDVLRALFGDKLSAENTETDRGIENPKTNDEVIEALSGSDNRMLEAYGHFIEHRNEKGLEMDHNYINAGRELLLGHSILFNNPFYYDLIPYIFYPMNRLLLTHKKVLIVLGRLDTEDEIKKWCEEGLVAVNNVPTLWNIGLLDSVEQEELDVGIITRSMVHDLALHEKNQAFLENVGMMVLMEPSRLLTTAQIGLNSLVRYCTAEDEKPVFCSIDKNCDGLLDALSHVLMASLAEVSATIHPTGDSSYMCWDGDSDHLSHRMVPNLSRYLGFGTELSFAALKNQVSETWWYGGDGFPVTDIRWIAGQYYHELLNYASLPASQETMDERFHVSHKLWDAKKAGRLYLTVEDESNNLFEAKRDFSTRAMEDGFINVIAPEYLMKDYMTDNADIFSADPKAIPCIVADYAHTKRNVAMRLCLRMSIGLVWESDLNRELLLIDASVKEPARSLWQAICDVNSSCGERHHGVLTFDEGERTFTFGEDVIRMKRKYNMHTASVENAYYIDNTNFIRLYVNSLKSAEYIAEDEQGNRMFLGSEIMGQIYQNHLPGQFMTMGGKHYEMLYVTADNRVVMRRAADHITGRQKYRQVREYTLSHLMPDTRMGSSRRRDGLQAQMFFADIDVKTPAYWKMDRYNDFATAHKLEVNGIPDRTYRNKRVLKLTFEGGAQEMTAEICRTLTVLLNEVFLTLYAENQCFIAALMPGAEGVPLTYTVTVEDDNPVKDGTKTAEEGQSVSDKETSVSGAAGDKGTADSLPDSDNAAYATNADETKEEKAATENCIYIVEDSQLDIGLLESVDRNLDRIFAILCDYLDWHGVHLEKSQNPPPEEEPIAEMPEKEEEPKKKFILYRILMKIKSFFKRLFAKIKNFFQKLFGGKKKDPEDGEGTGTAEGSEAGSGDGEETGTTDGGEAGSGDGEDTGTADGDEAGNANGGEATGTAEEKENVTGETEKDSEEKNAGGEMPATAEDEPAEAAGTDTDSDYNDFPAGFASTAPPRHILMRSRMFADEEPETSAAAGTDAGIDTEPAARGGEEPQMEFEPDNAKSVDPAKMRPERKPYHERYYLLYGGTAEPEGIATKATYDFLAGLGYGNSELKQARDGKEMAGLIENGFQPGQKGKHYCDFCGTMLVGTEYEVLSDGRERCMNCSRTAIRTEAEFKKLYKGVVNNMMRFYGIKFTVPIHVRMVNAKRLHRALGQSFVPTGNSDGRTLGVAILKNGTYTILLENGSPRLMSIMTMAHELTHIWQFCNWDQKKIRKQYGKENELYIYEGMAKWSEIQYAYLINEPSTAKREDVITRKRDDEYGRGYLLYLDRYPLSRQSSLKGETPFMNIPPL